MKPLGAEAQHGCSEFFSIDYNAFLNDVDLIVFSDSSDVLSCTSHARHLVAPTKHKLSMSQPLVGILFPKIDDCKGPIRPNPRDSEDTVLCGSHALGCWSVMSRLAMN